MTTVTCQILAIPTLSSLRIIMMTPRWRSTPATTTYPSMPSTSTPRDTLSTQSQGCSTFKARRWTWESSRRKLCLGSAWVGFTFVRALIICSMKRAFGTLLLMTHTTRIRGVFDVAISPSIPCNAYPMVPCTLPAFFFANSHVAGFLCSTPF